MSNLDALSVCQRLEADKTLATLFDILRDYGDAPAALWLKGEQELSSSYAEMARRADDFAACISAIAPEEGWIGIAVDTCHNWPALYWGVMRSGHNALLLDASAPDNVIQGLLDEAHCRQIISRKPRALSGNIHQIDFKTIKDAPRAIGFTPAWGEYTAMCTSGTTGTSRIFAYNGKAVCEQALNALTLFKTNPRIVHAENFGRKTLAFLPFHHVLGFMGNVILAHFMGTANVYLQDRTPNSILNTCHHFPPNLLIMVPLVGNSLVRSVEKGLKKENKAKQSAFKTLKALSLARQTLSPEAGLEWAQKKAFASLNEKLIGTEVDVVIFGGSHTPTETMRTLNALGYYTVTGYGMTETAINGFETGMDLKHRLNGSVGKPLPSAEYRIIPDKEGSKTGELQIRGAGIHSARVINGQILPPDTVDGGWMPTGDIAQLDATGRLYIRGRLKDVIINESGENVYPDDMEDAFAALNGVDQFCVVGFRRNRRDNNEDIVLVMNVGENYTDNQYLDKLAAKVAAANSRLPLYTQLNRAIVTPMKLPLVSGIKVKRIELKRMYEQGELAYRELDLRAQNAGAEVAAAAAIETKSARHDEILKKVRTMYAEALEISESEITDNANFIEDLQGDSLQVLSIALKAEEEWGITIPAEEYGSCATVLGMSHVVESLLDGGTADSAKPHERTPVLPITRFEDTPEYKHFLERQEALVGKGDNPYFVAHESPLLDTGIIDGKEVLEFGSYNYVGMSGRKEVKDAAKAAIDKYGTSASGSRLLAGEKQVHKDLEKEIADWKHTEDAIVCVGGHSTNVTFVGNFCGKNDLILYDALAHNSIEQGCKLSDATSRPFPHSDTAALETILKSQRAYYEKVLIVIEGAYSMDGDIAPVPDFVRIKKEYGCFLMVDEAHSACVIGETGGGVDEYFHLNGDDIDIKYGTLSKGLGTCGGYLAGKKCMIDYLRYNMPGFVFSVGISPALAAGSLAAIRTLRSHPEIMENLRIVICGRSVLYFFGAHSFTITQRCGLQRFPSVNL
ncbi:MAG: aminotransferase class I/II-fold pyridoxal phosphate-dependent enzyme [Clostridia bacterium]|nr:aminotransferase class I/II-fold pyridoxal phosphate-dependent enzyme [Clostridia bacterium]